MSYRNRLEKMDKFTFPLLIVGSFLSFSSMTISAQTLADHLGYPSGTKLIIVHADDLGETHAVNAAAIKSLEAGSINSASLMVPCPWFPEITDYAKSHPSFDFGLHLTLNQRTGVLPLGPRRFKGQSSQPGRRKRLFSSRLDRVHKNKSPGSRTGTSRAN